MKALVLILTVVGVVASLPVQWRELPRSTSVGKSPHLGGIITFCNKTVEALVINDFTLTPDPPQPNKELTVIVNYTLTEVVSGGNVMVSAMINKIPLIKETYGVCDLVVDAGLKCPVGKVTSSYKTSVSIPDVSGDIEASVKVTDQNGKELACIDAKVTL